MAAMGRTPAHRRAYLKCLSVKIDLKLKAGSCVDCGLRCTRANYFVFDWDHINPSEKTVGIASINTGLDSLEREIEKCELVCANCHRYRTFYDRFLWRAATGEIDYREQLSLFDEEDLSA